MKHEGHEAPLINQVSFVPSRSLRIFVRNRCPYRAPHARGRLAVRCSELELHSQPGDAWRDDLVDRPERAGGQIPVLRQHRAGVEYVEQVSG